jgi:hypothetical protein
MAYDGWIEFGGAELINLSRTAQLADALGIDTVWTEPDTVAWIQDALGGTDYDVITSAPWYDAGYPASAEFAGIVPLSIVGLDDSTLEASTVEYITSGGSSNKPRNKTLPLVANVAVVASTPRGADYGKRWLDRMLRGGGARTFCAGSDLRYFRWAQRDGEDAPPQAHRRDVTLTRGTSVTRKRATHCSATWMTTFTWTANDPFEYGDEELMFTDLGGEIVNLIDNGFFETDASFWHVGSEIDDTFTRDTSEFYSGVASGKFETTAGSGLFYPDEVPGTVGEPSPYGNDFALSFRTKGTPGNRLRVQWIRLNGGTVFADLIVDPLTADWQHVTLVGSIPEGTDFWSVYPLFRAMDGGTVWVDDVVVVPGLVPKGPEDLGPGVLSPSVTESGSLALVEVECPAYDYSPIYDPLYPALVPSPTAPEFYPDGWDLLPGVTIDRFWARIVSVEPSEFNVVPVLTLTTDEDARMVRVSIWPSTADEGDFCDPLWTAIVTYLPAGLDFVIDGEQEASYAWDGVSPAVRRTDSLVFGTGANPISWTAFNDPVGLLVTLDIMSGGSGDYDGGGTVRAALSLVPKSD